MAQYENPSQIHKTLKRINVLWLAYLKHEHFLQQYTVKHVFYLSLAIGNKEASRIELYTLNFFHFTTDSPMFQNVPCDLLSFKYPTF